MTNDEIPKYPREIRISKSQVEGSDRDTLFGRHSRFGIRHSFVLGYLGVSSLPGFRTREKSGLAAPLSRRPVFASLVAFAGGPPHLHPAAAHQTVQDQTGPRPAQPPQIRKLPHRPPCRPVTASFALSILRHSLMPPSIHKTLKLRILVIISAAFTNSLPKRS